MNTIGFNNFRRFKSFPEIDLGDITILVGGNNAGKSTLVKAILLLRDFLRSRIEGANQASNSFEPKFKFDSEHVNVGDFYRAFCRQTTHKENTISFIMKIDSFHFIVKIRGERKPGVIPFVSLIAVSDEERNVSFTYDFTKTQMTAHFGYNEEASNNNMLYDFPIEQQIKDLKNKLFKSKDFGEITELKLRIEQLEKEEYALRQDKHIEKHDDVTINMSDLSLFMNANVGKLVIPELIKWVSYYAETGTLGDKRSKEYKVQEAEKTFLHGNTHIINKIVEDLEDTLNKQVIEYIYAHSVSQTPCYSNATSSNDYTIKTIHEFYTSKISSGDEEFSIIEKWLKQFGIGNSLKVIPFIGDSYRLVVFDDDNPEIANPRKQGYPGGMDLADKGMGSIQLVILLIRIATLIRKYKGQNPTVLLEEPEQNLHPALQSKLADLIYDINNNFGIRFIIETHSEYLVRHTQVLAAEQMYEESRSLDQVNKSIKVYYLSQERGIIDMLFMGNAKFQDTFDEGFFDQAARESLTISRLERINKEK